MPAILCKCGKPLFSFVEKTGLYKVTYFDKSRKGGELLCCLPVTTACGACFKSVTVCEQPESDVRCSCRNGKGLPMIRSYKAERKGGEWVLIFPSRIQKSVDCSDAFFECQNDDCGVRVFVAEYHKTGKVLLTSVQEYYATHEFQPDGSIHVLGKNNLPPEVVDLIV